jgi:hypothetical protein
MNELWKLALLQTIAKKYNYKKEIKDMIIRPFEKYFGFWKIK